MGFNFARREKEGAPCPFTSGSARELESRVPVPFQVFRTSQPRFTQPGRKREARAFPLRTLVLANARSRHLRPVCLRPEGGRNLSVLIIGVKARRCTFF